MLAVLVEKKDPTGESRARQRDEGKALAGQSTWNRLELTGAVVEEGERYQKVALDADAVDRMLVAQAEHLEKGSRPRLVVTSLESEAWPAQRW